MRRGRESSIAERQGGQYCREAGRAVLQGGREASNAERQGGQYCREAGRPVLQRGREASIAELIVLYLVGFWSFAMKTSGYDIEAIVKVANSSDNIDPAKRDEACGYLVGQLNRHITYHRHQTKVCHFIIIDMEMIPHLSHRHWGHSM